MLVAGVEWLDHPQRRDQTGLGQHVDRLLLDIVELYTERRPTKEHGDHAVTAADAAHRAPVAVDGHRVGRLTGSCGMCLACHQALRNEDQCRRPTLRPATDSFPRSIAKPSFP